MRIAIRQGVDWGIAGLLLAAVALGMPQTASADIIHADDVIINGGSLCVGFDGVNGESFGFDTIRLKENNLRLHFEDTSTSASFPSNDWRIVINDSSNGGGNYFGVEDSTAGRIPFRVEAGARANALYVDSQGDIGIGTSTPVVKLHVRDGNTPTLRLEQDGSSGFTAQTWDVAGNEANFFIRDATNGSKLPFRIQPNSPQDSMFIKPGVIIFNEGSNNQDIRIESDGDNEILFVDAGQDRIGIGTSSPEALLHLQTPGTPQIIVESTVNEDIRYTLRPDNGFAEQWSIVVDAQGQNRMQFVRGSLVNAHLWEIDNSGNVTATSFNPTSSRAAKQDIRPLEAEKALAALREMDPVEFAYIIDPEEAHVGFIAEDVPELIANKDRKSLNTADIVAVVTKVVKEQQAEIERLQTRLEKLEQNAD